MLCLCVFMSTITIPVVVNAAETDGQIYTLGGNPFYSVGQTVGVLIQDADLNTNNTRQTVTATVYSTSYSEAIQIYLNEENENSDRFIGQVTIGTTTDQGTYTIKGNNGDEIGFFYLDESNSSGTSIERNTFITFADRVHTPTANITDIWQEDGTPVELESLTVSAAVYYTLNGNEPQWPDEHNY